MSADPVPVTISPPSGLAAKPISYSEIDLSWAAPTNLGGITVTGYTIERSGDYGTTWDTVVANTGNSDASYSDTGLHPNTPYAYRVSAMTVLATSKPSNVAAATTLGPPVNLTVISQDNTGASLPGLFTRLYLNGTRIDSGYTPHTFNVYSSKTYTVEMDIQYGSYAFGSWQDTGSTLYSRTISTDSDKMIVATYNTTPHPPTNLSATPISTSQIVLRWTAPADNGGAPVTGYRIGRSTDGGTTWNLLVSSTGNVNTSYSDTGLSPSNTYVYRVFAINAVGQSRASNVVTATTPATATVSSPPTNMTAAAVSSSQINLRWSAPADDGDSPVTGYRIERESPVGGGFTTLVANTASASTTYSDIGLGAGTQYNYRVSAINAIGTSKPSVTACATTLPRPITKYQSGLLVSDSLTNETKTQQQLQSNPRYWIFGGDAPNEGARYDFFKDIRGLHVGARAPANGTWAGYFAVSPDTNATLFHSVLTTPVGMLPYQIFENGMYIQTSKPFVNYVTCVSVTSHDGIAWAVVSTLGNASQANQFNVLYVDPSSNQSLTRDCTIITNGSNYLKVYLDGQMVYSNSTMNLHMPMPFNTYLEPQSSYPGRLLNGTYEDYYATAGENVRINNLPSNTARVDIVDGTGMVIANGTASSGSAILDIGKYHFPLAANIRAYDLSNTLVASTPSMMSIYGGDVYQSH